MKKFLKITLIKSISRIPQQHKLILEALGLRKIGKTKRFSYNLAIEGMVKRVKHLLKVEEE